MIGRARFAAALAALVLVPLATITNLTGAAAQNDGRIDLVAQTAFVGDDPATIDLRVIAPADSTIRIQIFEARTTREDIRASYIGLGEQRPFSNFICDVDEPLDEAPCQLNSTGEIFSIEIPDEEIGEILRINQGALPVVITLEDSNGDVIDTLITHLLVLEEQRRPTLHVAFIADLSAPLAVQPDQTINLDTQNLFARAERIAERNEIPITVALQPETLQALAISSSEQLTEFAELLSDRPVLNAPWVDLDEEAWRLTGDTTLIADQYTYGATVISEMLGRGPSNISKLDADATIETLALLRSNGTQAVLVPPNQITGRTTDSRELAPFQLRDATGTALTAIAIDTSLRQTLNHADPELAGHRALTELAIEAANATVDRAILFDFDQLEPAALEVLLDGINERSNLRTSPLTRALQVPVARDTDGQPVQATLKPTQAPDLSQRAADIGVTRGTVDAYASMVAPARTPITALETLIRAAAASSLSDEQSAAYTLSVFDAVLAGTANITIEPAERITLTDRRANLRITIRNGQPLPITVDLLLSAEKLRFHDGERLSRTLVPGDNEITVRVETLASGDARVTVAITSPGGQLELHEGVIDIRSTAISGLGLVISIIALIVLGGWWVRTIRRVRRNRAAATVAATDQTANAEATTAEASADEQSTQPQTNQTQQTRPRPTTSKPGGTVTVRIVTDSACDLRGDEVDELGIEVVPLSIRFGETEYIDREELSVEEFYSKLASADTLPETAAPAPGRFDQAFRRQLDAGASGIVCINLSAALSATMQSAKTAAAAIDGDIRVVDSRSITVGLGSIVIAAAEMAADGATTHEIETAVVDLSDRTHVFGALDTLENLKKGGRIGGAQALLGSMLAIKPILDLSSGEVQEASKQRTRKKALAWLRDKLAEYDEAENLAIMHGQAPDLDDFLSMIDGIVDIREARIELIGPVVGTHGGPGVIGFALQS